jgi:hypothetical protein
MPEQIAVPSEDLKIRIVIPRAIKLAYLTQTAYRLPPLLHEAFVAAEFRESFRPNLSSLDAYALRQFMHHMLKCWGRLPLNVERAIAILHDSLKRFASPVVPCPSWEPNLRGNSSSRQHYAPNNTAARLAEATRCFEMERLTKVKDC